MDTKRVLNVDTRAKKGAKEVRTVLTLDYTGVTATMLQNPAEQSLVITWQAQKRRGALATPSVAIPSSETIKVADFIAAIGQRAGGPPTVESAQAQLGALTGDEQMKALQTRYGLSEAEARKIVFGKEAKKAA